MIIILKLTDKSAGLTNLTLSDHYHDKDYNDIHRNHDENDHFHRYEGWSCHPHSGDLVDP